MSLPEPLTRTLRIAAAAFIILGVPTMAHAEKAYLEITLKVDAQDRPAAGAIYTKYKQPFLSGVTGATSKELLIRDDDVQVLHGFKTRGDAENYLKSDLFNHDVVTGLKPLLKAAPEVRIYTAD
jgi:hypothetical protein